MCPSALLSRLSRSCCAHLSSNILSVLAQYAINSCSCVREANEMPSHRSCCGIPFQKFIIFGRCLCTLVRWSRASQILTTTRTKTVRVSLTTTRINSCILWPPARPVISNTDGYGSDLPELCQGLPVQWSPHYRAWRGAHKVSPCHVIECDLLTPLVSLMSTEVSGVVVTSTAFVPFLRMLPHRKHFLADLERCQVGDAAHDNHNGCRGQATHTPPHRYPHWPQRVL